MSPLEAVAILAAGFAAGTINTIVGSGSLLTFPALLALGYPPVVANVSNTVGLVPGSISGAIGYRRELRGQVRRVVLLSVVGAAGGLTGALLLLALPATSFERVVPFLVLGACALVALQPRLSRTVANRRSQTGREHPLPLLGGVFLTGIYGGYFGAAQGVILIALLGIFLTDDIQRLNGLKNVITAVVNGVAGVLFVLVAPVAWPPALLLAAGAIVGGQVGAVVARRLPPTALRGTIVVVGTIVGLRLLLGGRGGAPRRAAKKAEARRAATVAADAATWTDRRASASLRGPGRSDPTCLARLAWWRGDAQWRAAERSCERPTCAEGLPCGRPACAQRSSGRPCGRRACDEPSTRDERPACGRRACGRRSFEPSSCEPSCDEPSCDEPSCALLASRAPHQRLPAWP